MCLTLLDIFVCLALTGVLASIVVPPEGYLARVHELCKKHNVLLICDEIQTVSQGKVISRCGNAGMLITRSGIVPHREDALLRARQRAP